MAKLIAFYSRADENYFSGAYRYVKVGNTEKVANMIAEATGAALYKIEQVTPYSADYSTCINQAQEDKRANARPELVAFPENMDEYDEIYLGYPNWWGDMPMAVYTFMEAYDFDGKTIIPFCTHGGSGLSATENSIALACPNSTILTGFEIEGTIAQNDYDTTKARVEQWLEKIK